MIKLVSDIRKPRQTLRYFLWQQILETLSQVPQHAALPGRANSIGSYHKPTYLILGKNP